MTHSQLRRGSSAHLTLLALAALAQGAAAQCTFTPTATLVSIEGYQAATYLFGRAIATDGVRLAIGAPGLKGFPGTAFAFERYGDAWYPLQELAHAGAQSDDRFGAAAVLSGDRLLVGAPGAASLTAFEAQAGVWIETQRITLPGPAGRQSTRSVEARRPRASNTATSVRPARGAAHSMRLPLTKGFGAARTETTSNRTEFTKPISVSRWEVLGATPPIMTLLKEE